MSPRQPSKNSEQAAGLSTAESDSMSGRSTHSVANSDVRPVADVAAKISTRTSSPPPSKSVSKSKGGILFSNNILSPIKKSKNDSASLNQSITNSAPTILIQTPSSTNDDPGIAPLRRPLRSAMSSRTLHESLHRGRVQQQGKTKMKRSVSFAQVRIREYERVMGDNPSVRAGPPLSLGWRCAADPIIMTLDDYEDGKGLPRSSSEYLVPKAVREKLLREHADVSRSDMVHTIRVIQKEKARRRKTVVNLNMQGAEERFEGAKRKIKKILKPSSSYDSMEARMWDEAHAVAMEKARRLEESIHRGESVSSRELYRVGTPRNNILPSRTNSMTWDPNSLAKNGTEQQVGGSDRTSTTEESSPKKIEYAPKLLEVAKNNDHQLRRSNDEELDRSMHQDQKIITKGGEEMTGRANNSIVASEHESEEIFARLLLDDDTESRNMLENTPNSGG